MHTSAKIIGTILILLSTNSLFGQDIHFSQYFNSPLSLNPAETGNFEGDWRVMANYRDQWRAIAIPYKTLSAGYDQQYYFQGHHFSPGFYVIQDNSGSEAISVTKIYGSLAYHRIVKDNAINFGMQIGYVFQSIDFSRYTFPANYNNDKGIFEPDYGMENVDNGNDHSSYADVNLGVSWSRKINRFEPDAGFAVFHVNHPTESYFNNANSRLPLRTAFHASVKTLLGKNIYIKPGFMFVSMRSARDIMVGGQAGIAVQGNQYNIREVFAGLYLRNGIPDPADAFMVMGGAQFRNLAINISYDVNVSALNPYSNHRGAFEISLIYKSISSIIKTFTIPCERI